MDTIQFVRAELLSRKGEWLHIARGSGVSYRALCNVVHHRNDPRVSTVANLASWLRANPRGKAARAVKAREASAMPAKVAA